MQTHCDFFHWFWCLIFIEISCHWNLISFFCLLLINPCFRCVWQYFSFEILLDIFCQWHIFCITQRYICHRLAFLYYNFSIFISLGLFYDNLLVSKFLCIEDFTLAINTFLISIYSIIFKCTICLYNQITTLIRNIISFCSNTFSSYFITM